MVSQSNPRSPDITSSEVVEYCPVISKRRIAPFVTQFRKILRGKPDGVMLSTHFIEASAALTNKRSRQGIPFVFTDSDIEGQNSVS